MAMMAQQVVATGAWTVLDNLGASLREAFFMFWDTGWALVLGFAPHLLVLHRPLLRSLRV